MLVKILLIKYIINFEVCLTFREPCIAIYSYNKIQQDALFLNFIVVKNSAYFEQTHCPSSGVLILYSQQLIFVIQYEKHQLLWIQYWESWRWTESLSETCRVLYHNKIEK